MLPRAAMSFGSKPTIANPMALELNLQLGVYDVRLARNLCGYRKNMIVFLSRSGVSRVLARTARYKLQRRNRKTLIRRIDSNF